MTRRRKWVLAALVGVGLLAAGLLALASNERVTTALAAGVIGALGERLPVALRFEAVAVSPLAGTVVVSAPAVYTHAGERLGGARALHLRLDWAAVAEGRWRLDRVRLIAPDATIVHEGLGRYNVSPLLAGRSGPPGRAGLPFEVGALTIEAGRFRYEDRPRRAAIALEKVSATIANPGPGRFEAEARVGAGWARLRAASWPLAGAASARLDGRELTLRHLEGRLGRTRLTAAGTVRDVGLARPDAHLAVQVSGQLAGLSALAPWPLDGEARARLTLDGPPRAPRLTLALDGSGWRLAGAEVGSVEARLAGHWADERLVLDRLDLDALGGRWRGTGSAAPFGDAPAAFLRGRLIGLPLERIGAAWGRPGLVTGTAEGDVQVAARGGKRPRLEGTLRLAARGAVGPLPGAPSKPTAFTGDARLGLSRLGLEVHAATVRLGRGRLEARGRWPLRGPVALSLSGYLPELGPLAASAGRPALAGGPWRLEGRAEGRPEALRLAGRLEARGLRLRGRAAADRLALVVTGTAADRLSLSGTLTASGLAGRGGTLRAPFAYAASRAAPLGGTLALTALEARLGGGVLRADGRWTLGPDLPGRLTVSVEGDAAEALAMGAPGAAAGQPALPTAAALTGRARVAGPFGRPRALSAELEVSRLRVAYPAFAIRNAGPIRASWTPPGRADLEMHLVGPHTDLRLTGGLGPSSPVGLTLAGRLDLALLRAFPSLFPGAAGSVTFEGHLRDLPGRPGFAGRLEVLSGTLATRALPQPLRDLEASLVITNDKLVLERLHAALGWTGEATASGVVRLGPGWRPAGFAGQLEVPAMALRAEGVSAIARAELAIAGDRDAARLDGRVTLIEGRWTAEPDAVYRWLRRDGGRPRAPLPPLPWLDAVALRVDVLAPASLSVRTAMLEGVASADLTVLGTAARPVLIGRVGMAAGSRLRLHGRVFELDEAAVELLDPRRNRLLVTFAATTRVGRYDVRVQAAGPPDALRIAYASTPYLPAHDVRVMLATGRTPADLARRGEGLSVLTGFALDQAGLGLASVVAGPGALDLLSLEPGVLGPAALGGIGGVTLGKRLSDRLTVAYTRAWPVAGGRSPGQVLWVDYQLDEALGIALAQELGGGFAASARYRVATW